MTQNEPPNASPSTDETKDAVRGGGDLSVNLFARTDVGQIREHNEDNFLVADLTRKARGLLQDNRTGMIGHHGSLFAVCDGMGGAAAGEIASQLAVDILYDRMVEGLEEGHPLARDDLARRLVRAIESAGLRIFQEAKLDRTRRGMGTTVTAAALVDEYLFLAQVGDSRGYVLRQGQLVQLTRDQSLVNQLIEAGQLTEEEAETFEHNNIILQALGTADSVQVDLTYCELRRGDTLLLCSDGLSGMVRFEDIREVLRGTADPVEACRLLTERANQAGGHDNITVVVVQFGGTALKPAEGSPLGYRKYVLPEEAVDQTEPGRRPSADIAAVAMAANDGARPSHPQGLSATVVFSPGLVVSTPPQELKAKPGPAAAMPGATLQDEQIEIPGTHVPPLVVVAIVFAVILVLAGTALLLLT